MGGSCRATLDRVLSGETKNYHVEFPLKLDLEIASCTGQLVSLSHSSFVQKIAGIGRKARETDPIKAALHAKFGNKKARQGKTRQGKARQRAKEVLAAEVMVACVTPPADRACVCVCVCVWEAATAWWGGQQQ